MSYSASTSKKLVNYNGQTSAGGSYTHLLNWLSDQASDLIPIPDGLVKSVIDNEQVVGKTHTVKADNKVPMTVLTSHAYLSIDAASSIQKDKSLKPSEWLFQDPSQELKQDILNYGEKSAPNFRTTRNAWIASRLEAVLAEHSDGFDRDHIDLLLEKQRESQMEKNMC